MELDMKQTPLYDIHLSLGATMGDFGGWNMPLWYKTGQIAEHKATREKCALFDICHMGEFIVKGKDSFAFWRKILSNNVSAISDGQAQYNFMLNENGGVIDDCIVYRFNEEYWMLVVNAGTQDSDYEWLKKNALPGMVIENISDRTGKIDLQGPSAPKVIADIAGRDKIESMKFFRFVEKLDLNGVEVLLSRTGYTGEIGFEIYCDIEKTVELWNMIIKAGEKHGIIPAGLGARDTLRLEAGLPLSGSEIKPDVPAVGTPWEFAISYDHDFIGKKSLESKKGSSFVYAVEIEGKRKPGHHAEVISENEKVGVVTSDILSVSLGMKPAGFIMVEKELSIGKEIELLNEKGKIFKAVVAENPLHKGTARKKMTVMLDR
jgi:aminomethyltransferase